MASLVGVDMRATMDIDTTVLWREDHKGKSSYIFGETFMHELCTDVIVESNRNNHELVKAVKGLTDKENWYIIALDNSFDNVQVSIEQKILKREAAVRDNVFLLDLICFEYTLLEFDNLIELIYAEDDEFLDKRASVISAREKLVETLKSGEFNYKALQEVMEYDKNLDDHNIEQISAKLLFDLTRNTGFEVSKGTIGECWIKSCCEWLDRQVDDIYGLDKNRLSVTDKMKSIYSGTSLSREFSNIGLKVSI